MKTVDTIEKLIAAHTLVSNQINTDQLGVILSELERVIERETPGAIVEFGCYIGTTSLFLRRLLDTHHESQSRQFHVYDSFVGLPEKQSADVSAVGVDFTAGALAVSKQAFLGQFRRAGLTPPVIHKSWFRDIALKDVPEKIAFAFLDGDFYTSIRDSFRLIMPRMQPGGVIVIDDYAREALPGVAKATHEIFAPERIRTVQNLGIVRF